MVVIDYDSILGVRVDYYEPLIEEEDEHIDYEGIEELDE
jgi:hypothetical protein